MQSAWDAHRSYRYAEIRSDVARVCGKGAADGNHVFYLISALTVCGGLAAVLLKNTRALRTWR